MTETTNYSLKKPDQSDRVLIADLNGNADTIDTELKKNADTIQSVSDKANGNATDISELQSKSETAETDITNLKKKDTETDVKIQGIETRVQNTEDWIKGMQNPLVIKGTVTDVSELESKTSEAKPGWIYFVGNDSEEKNKYEEYVFTEDKNWERIGSAKIDLSQYVTLDNFNAELEKKADVSALSDYVKTEKLTDVFKTYGIENEQEVPILKQTIGYESRNLLPYPERITVGGITFTFDSDGYMTCSNTSSDTRLYTHDNAQQHVFLKKGRYCVTFFAKTPATNEYANIVLLDKNDTFVCVFDNKNFANKEKDMIYFSLDSDKEVYVVAKPFDGVIAIQIQLANAQPDDTYQPYTPTVNDRLLALENLDAPVIAKKYKLNNAISFEDGKLGQRVFQEKIPVSVDGYTPVCSCVSYVIHSESYNPISFLSGNKAYVNAYAATNERHTETEQMEVTVTFISNEYCQGITTVSSDEPSLEGPSFETEQRYLEEEPSYE